LQDFPYAPSPVIYARETAAIENATFLTDNEKAGLFHENVKAVLS
jgi:hypothetical protein